MKEGQTTLGYMASGPQLEADLKGKVQTLPDVGTAEHSFPHLAHE